MHGRALILDDGGRVLRRVSPEYLALALARGEVTPTEHTLIYTVAPFTPEVDANQRRRLRQQLNRRNR